MNNNVPKCPLGKTPMLRCEHDQWEWECPSCGWLCTQREAANLRLFTLPVPERCKDCGSVKQGKDCLSCLSKEMCHS